MLAAPCRGTSKKFATLAEARANYLLIVEEALDAELIKNFRSWGTCNGPSELMDSGVGPDRFGTHIIGSKNGRPAPLLLY